MDAKEFLTWYEQVWRPAFELRISSLVNLAGALPHAVQADLWMALGGIERAVDVAEKETAIEQAEIGGEG